MTKHKKYKSKKLTPKELDKSILRLFNHNPKKRYNPNRIVTKLKVKNSKETISKTLDKLASKGKVRKVKEGLYQAARDDEQKETPEIQNRLTGRLDVIRSGAGYVIPERGDDDIYIPKKYLKTALHDDRVEVEVYHRKGARRPEGRVIKVLERARVKFVGTCWHFGKRYVVEITRPNARFEVDIIKPTKAKNGDRVIVKVEHFGAGGQMKGIVDTILSSEKAHDIEMNSILINAGFDISFSEEVLDEANSLTNDITPEDLELRRDMRDVITFTIDPLDAKDFDDAISYRILDNGHTEIGVHIADVSHFVKEGTSLDKEALKRSTSVYLVDRVCPMLPERLSNKLCSLRPNEDKFTFSAVFTFDEKYQIHKRWFGKTLIHSDIRFTYEEAQDVLDSGDGPFAEELLATNRIAHHLRKKRYRNGSIKFETDEVRFNLDDDNQPVGVYIKDRIDTHLLVEDLMLLANKEVAAFIGNRKNDKEIPFVYRIHDEPDPDKLRDFALLAAEFGLSFNLNTPKEIAQSFNAIADKLENTADINMLMPLAIRTMAKAEYSPDNIGHYGLAFDYYTHFTSPIRRYADLLVHRILFKNLSSAFRTNKPALETKCQHISRQERKAIDAERESTKYMQVVYMENKVGQIFLARVSGLIEKGIFVEVLESRAEGLIPFSELGTVKALTSNSVILHTEDGERKLRFGDQLHVRLIGLDTTKRQLDFIPFVQEEEALEVE